MLGGWDFDALRMEQEPADTRRKWPKKIDQNSEREMEGDGQRALWEGTIPRAGERGWARWGGRVGAADGRDGDGDGMRGGGVRRLGRTEKIRRGSERPG